MESNNLDEQTAKFIAAVVQAMPTELSLDVMQGWIENPRALRGALHQALSPSAEPREGTPFQIARSEASFSFPVWRTIRVGTFPSAAALMEAVIAMENPVKKRVKRLLLKVGVCRSEKEIDLVRVSRSDLCADKDVYNHRSFWEKVQRLGLELCPDEVAAQLYLQDIEQTEGTVLFIGTRGIRLSATASSDRIFYLEKIDGKLVLRENDVCWGTRPYDQWVFVKPRKN